MNQNSNIDNKFILKDNYTIDKTNYEKIKLSEEYNQLYSTEYRENIEMKKSYVNKKIFNLSFKELIQNRPNNRFNIGFGTFGKIWVKIGVKIGFNPIC